MRKVMRSSYMAADSQYLERFDHNHSQTPLHTRLDLLHPHQLKSVECLFARASFHRRIFKKQSSQPAHLGMISAEIDAARLAKSNHIFINILLLINI